MSRVLPCALCVPVFAGIQILQAAPAVYHISPGAGAPGTVVSVTGTGFGTETGAVTAKVGGAPATVVSVASELVRINAPAVSGPVEITVSGKSSTSPLPFTATRTVTGSFVPPAGMDASGYETGLLTSRSASLNFSVPAATDKVDTVWAWGGENQSMFGALIFPGQTTVRIDAASTARVLIAVCPLTPRGDAAALDELLAGVEGTAELAAVISLIEQAAAGGYSYTEDGRFEAAYDALLMKAYVPAMAASPLPLTPRAFVPSSGGRVKALKPEHGAAPLRLKYTFPAQSNDPVRQLIVSSSDTNPTHLHQNVELWRVNPSSLSDGFAHLDRLSITDRPAQLDSTPYASGFVSAKLGSSNFDVPETVADSLGGYLFGKNGKAPSEAVFNLPGTRPGVYMVNSYSGNAWYGSIQAIDPGASQVVLLNQIDVNGQWTDALVANLVIAAVDLVSVGVPEVKKLGGAELSKVLQTVSTSVVKTIIAYRSAHGGLDTGAVREIGRASVSGALKAILSLLTDLAGDNTWRGTASRYFGFAFRLTKLGVNAAARVSNLLQTVERGVSLVTPTHFAVERAVVVVGDPFSPRITGFYPRSGRGGDTIVLTGESLPFDTSGYTVNFVKFASTGAPPELEKRLPATIVNSNLGNWTIKVPTSTQWEAAFGPGDREVFLGIQATATGGETTTQENAAPNALFRYRMPPQITGVTPNPAQPGTTLTVNGPSFDRTGDRGILVEVDGQPAGSADSIRPTGITFRLSDSIAAGPHTLRLVYRDSAFQIAGASNTVNFTVNIPFPPLNGNNIPRRLRVTTRSFNNVADGQISLYEAMALAGGTLGRSLTVRPPGQAEGQFESDWVDFAPGNTGSYGSGEAIRDYVSIELSATGNSTIMLTAPLPPPGDGDRLDIGGITFDGAGTPADTIGWDLRGVAGNSLEGGVTFKNFPGQGIVLGDGAHSNQILNPRVEACGGDGVLFFDEASYNRIDRMIVTGSGGVGIHLTGDGVVRNEISSAESIPLFGEPEVTRVLNSTEHGVLIEDGAHGNVLDVWEIRGSGGDGLRITGAGSFSNVIGGAYIPGRRDFAKNGGHGVSLLDNTSDNVIWNVSASGNQGDGFHLENTIGNNLRGISTSFDFAGKLTPAFNSRNAGNSVKMIDSAMNLIGTQMRGVLLNTPFCAFGGSLGGATVLITGAGSYGNFIDSANFGFIDPIDAPSNLDPALLVIPAATHALVLNGGASDNVIGHENRDAAVNIQSAPNGSGILIEGVNTDNNRVLGVTFGLPQAGGPAEPQRLRIGVHILDGPRGNRIGEVGEARGGGLSASQPYNAFASIVEAGIRLEKLDTEIDASGEPVGSNFLINNRMGFVSSGSPPLHPEVGIHLKGRVTGQWIGGRTRGEGNQISRYGFAGLWIEDGVIFDYESRNRITGTWTNAGVGSASTVNTNAFAGPLAAQGLLITGGSGQVVGEEWALYNQFNGSRASGYVNEGAGHWIRGCWFDSGLRGSLIIRNGGGHRIGGDKGADVVHITRSGTAGDDDTAGIVITGGAGNRVEGCLIGDRGTASTGDGSKSHGVLINDSSVNRIGGPGKGEGNLIARSAGDGIVIRGAQSGGNKIGGNSIGIGTKLSPLPGNTGAGIRMMAGAHDNLVGGEQIPAGQPFTAPALRASNIISGNGGDGVLVTGATTVGNGIMANSIYNNGGLGIRHANGGNHLHPPPVEVILSKSEITGRIGSLAVTPAGSRIEAFINDAGPAPEGKDFIEYGTVRADGTFTIVGLIPPGKVITATATHAVTGDTSEFTVGIELPDKFGFSLAVPQDESLRRRAWPSGAPFPAVVLTASTDSATVSVSNLHVHAAGTGGFAAALAGVSLFEDVDFNGVWSAADRELAPMTAFDAGTQIAVLPVTGALLSNDETRRWVLRLHPAAGVQPSGTVRLEILNAAAVGEFYWEPLGAVGVQAAFPLQTGLFEAGLVDPRAAWRTGFGLPADGSGDGADNADPDRDGLVNLAEYALGSSPVNSREAARPVAARATGPDRVTLTYQKLRADIVYTVETATDAAGPWSTTGVDQGGAGPAVTASAPLAGGRRFLRLRMSAN